MQNYTAVFSKRIIKTQARSTFSLFKNINCINIASVYRFISCDAENSVGWVVLNS